MKVIYTLLLIIIFDYSFGQTIQDCSICSNKIIKNDQIEELSIDEIRLLINEIFARNGYQFENDRFQNFFENKSWYKSKSDNKNISFTEVEKKNIKFFKDKIKELQADRQELVNQLKIFKTQILNNKKEELKTEFNFYYENLEGNDEEPKRLKEVLNKINFDDINYYRNNGLNSVMTDNGFVKIIYELFIENKEINLYYNYMSHSKIIKDFDEFTDYHSEGEYMYNWKFEFKNNKLKFIRLLMAG
ncbi:YARHG domain-containing protein [Flavobacterium oreochromis]|uniref:YARHG domain-containing protein n=2 Tax=Flavobacterium TaxID=237 RepID=A0ABW8P8X7_9FLAO|nr:YARHG domain-containing protein [Flavobacterium oreochromis]OWP76899.1 hypothetical protein BWG23_06590 [Flavobacterium oreochromis]